MLILPFIILDLVAGVTLLLRIEALALTIGILLLLKALMSLIPSIKTGFFLDVLGYIDMVGAIALILFHNHFSFGWYTLIGILLLAKGVFSFLIAR